MQIENKNYKDTVFRFLFNNKAYLLELYNALNSTSYTNPDDLEINTLEGHTFLNIQNDISFILDFELNLYEHQSTICPNMPLRDLYYLSELLSKTIPHDRTYRSNPVKIPVPRFFVFYNGDSPAEDKVVYRLSDLFGKETESPAVELIVTAYNVNEGHNQALLDACKTLKGYSIFVSKVRKYKKETEEKYNSEHSISLNNLVNKNEVSKKLTYSAISKAIDECIQEDVLKDFLMTHRQEVTDMSYAEALYKEQLQILADDAYETAYKAVYETAYENASHRINDLTLWLISLGRIDDLQKAASDPDYQEQLLKEYDSCHTS